INRHQATRLVRQHCTQLTSSRFLNQTIQSGFLLDALTGSVDGGLGRSAHTLDRQRRHRLDPIHLHE
ncbi:MAG: hypothetical protein OXG05_12715, partial [Gammaproteobacteria bacterium]|nr:hypothetical protein [Gammaproteobacteria bacterium]